MTGDRDAWITFFSTGVEAAADTTRLRIEGLLSWQEEALRAVMEARVSGLAERLTADLIGLPALRARQVAEPCGVTHEAGWIMRRQAGTSARTTPTGSSTTPPAPEKSLEQAATDA